MSILRTSEYDDSLRTEGYAVVRGLLTDADVRQAVEVYRSTDDGVGRSKYNSLEINERGHRRSVSNGLAPILVPRICAELEGYRPVGYNLAVKKAGSQEPFAMHIDDDHCDRTKHVGVNVWIPLVDVDRSNGSLYIVPRSHRLPATINGIGSVFPFPDHEDALMDRAVFMEMEAGDALVFDDRLIHGSLTNDTDQDRVAIICGWVPEDADLLLYLRHDDLDHGLLELFEIDDEALLDLRIGDRPTQYPSRGVFRQERPHLDLTTLTQILDGPGH